MNGMAGKRRRYFGLMIAAGVFLAISLAFYFDGVSYGGWRSELALYLYLLHIDRSGGVLQDTVVDYWIEREFNLVTSGTFFAVALLLVALRAIVLHRRRALRRRAADGTGGESRRALRASGSPGRRSPAHWRRKN